MVEGEGGSIKTEPQFFMPSCIHSNFDFPVMHSICEDFDLDFYAMYTMTGLWNSFFLILYSVFGVSNIMRWSTRYVFEIIA